MISSPDPRQTEEPVFDDAFRQRFVELLAWRRDIREFLTDPLPEGTFERLVEYARFAPSVGLSEPWRFVLVEDEARRDAVRRSFRQCNAEALACQEAARSGLYARLKLEGLSQAPVQFALFADPATPQGHRLGRATMPETAAYSAITAVYTLWLVARTWGLGLGWVSILDPAAVVAALDVPQDWTFLGYFCLGYPARIDGEPTLQRVGWEHRHDESRFILRR
jgi:5,6-dimethylbenzimidazole synthase